MQKLTKKYATLFLIIFSFNCIFSYSGFNIVVHTATMKATYVSIKKEKCELKKVKYEE